MFVVGVLYCVQIVFEVFFFQNPSLLSFSFPLLKLFSFYFLSSILLEISKCLISQTIGGLIKTALKHFFKGVLSTWKLNAFTCFAAFSWGERIVEVDACCVQLVFGKHDFDY